MVEMMAPTAEGRDLRPGLRHRRLPGGAPRVPRREHPTLLIDAEAAQHFHHSMFHGYDFDTTMLRIGSMNMLLHGVEAPDIRYRDSLSEGASGDAELYSLILANPPFAGSLDYESTAKDLQRVVKTKKTELLFLALFLRLLQARRAGGGHRPRRGAVRIVEGAQGAAPDAGRGPQARRRREAAVRRVQAVRRSVDRDLAFHQDRHRRHRQRLVLRRHGRRLVARRQAHAVARRGATRATEPASLSEDEHAKNNLPDVLARLRTARRCGAIALRTDQSFCVPKADIVAQDYDLSLNRYKEVVHDEVEHRPPLDIIADLERLEGEIQQGLAELKAML